MLYCLFIFVENQLNRHHIVYFCDNKLIISYDTDDENYSNYAMRILLLLLLYAVHSTHYILFIFIFLTYHVCI